MNSYLSQQIAALRRERGLTQEQLGQLVGVSAQAVSKWEKGGAPDVELLPVLADRLGVTVDRLFGRASEASGDLGEQLFRWFHTIPKEERLWRLFRLLAGSFLNIYFSSNNLGSRADFSDLVETCYAEDVFPGAQGSTWLRSVLATDEGMLLGVFAKNLPIFLLLPEPAGGYASHFAPNGDYRSLFAALSLEGSMEMLRYLYAQRQNYYTVSALAKRTGLSQATVETAARSLTQCNLLRQKSLELDEGTVAVYMVHDNYALVPFLYFARWLMEGHDAWYYGWDVRERPILAMSEGQAQMGKERSHESER